MKALLLALFVPILAGCGSGDGVFGVAGQGIGAVEFRIVSPAENGVVNETRPLIEWTVAEGASEYQIFVYTDANLQNLLDFQRTTELSARVGPDLPDGFNVFVEIKAVLPFGQFRTTGVIQFRIQLVP